MKQPYVLHFTGTGAADAGYISVAENPASVPFEIKRVFWTYHTPESIVRGRHAHYSTEQILVAVAGRIVVLVEMPGGSMHTFVLDRPDMGIYIPPNCWHTMQYSHAAVQMVLASTTYSAQDYIRDYETFKQVWTSPTT